MVRVMKQFTVRKLREPTEKNLSEDIEWVCNSLGFVGKRDQDKTAFLILQALIKAAKKGKGLTSEQLSEKVEPTVGSVLYHLKKLIKSGLVAKFGSVYELKMNSLLATIEEIEKDISLTIEDIKKVAKDVDENIGLDNRDE